MQLASSLEDIVSLGVGYHNEIKEIETAGLKCELEDRARVACHLGNVSGDRSGDAGIQAAVLRVELADTLIRGSNLPKSLSMRLSEGYDDELLRAVQDMLDVWKVHYFGVIRMRGLRLAELLGMQICSQNSLDE